VEVGGYSHRGISESTPGMIGVVSADLEMVYCSCVNIHVISFDCVRITNGHAEFSHSNNNSSWGMDTFANFSGNCLLQAVRSQAYGRSAHHVGCNGIACTPLCCIRNASSCKRGRALVTLVRMGPPQNSSAEVAARGHTIESRFAGDDCSVQRGCWPVTVQAWLSVSATWNRECHRPPRTNLY
jgi:hypothetical protein